MERTFYDFSHLNFNKPCNEALFLKSPTFLPLFLERVLAKCYTRIKFFFFKVAVLMIICMSSLDVDLRNFFFSVSWKSV